MPAVEPVTMAVRPLKSIFMGLPSWWRRSPLRVPAHGFKA
jgi:hypothetical protein